MPILAAVAGVSAGRLRESLARLQREEFIYQTNVLPAAEVHLRHALTHEVTYGSLREEQRRRQHARIAAAIESLVPETGERRPELLAQHHTLAGQHEAAIEYRHRAGQRALARGAYVEALTHIRTGLDLCEAFRDSPEGMRNELRLQLALGMGLMRAKGLGVPKSSARSRERVSYCDSIEESPEAFPVPLRLMGILYHACEDCARAGNLRSKSSRWLRGGTSQGSSWGRIQHSGRRASFEESWPTRASTSRRPLLCTRPETFASHAAIYGQDPGSSTSGLLAMTLALRGVTWTCEGDGRPRNFPGETRIAPVQSRLRAPHRRDGLPRHARCSRGRKHRSRRSSRLARTRTSRYSLREDSGSRGMRW